MIIDDKINNFFDNFRRDHRELMTSNVLREYIITNFTIEEKVMFYMRVVLSLSFYEIGDILNITYRQAQNLHQRIANKLEKVLYEVEQC